MDRDDQARRLAARVREASSAFNPQRRRELRDELAMKVVIAGTLREDSNLIDVGAHAGAILEIAVRVAPGGRHIAFEPIPEFCDRLTARFPGQDIRTAALSDVNGTAEFAHVLDRPSYSGLRRRADLPASARVVRTTVRTERLDDAIERSYVPALVKIDVEGAELQVLRGAARTLEEHRPLVVFEHGIGGADLYDGRSADVFDVLDQAGLRVFDLEGEGPYSRTRFEMVFTEPIWNFMAVPA